MHTDACVCMCAHIKCLAKSLSITAYMVLLMLGFCGIFLEHKELHG